MSAFIDNDDLIAIFPSVPTSMTPVLDSDSPARNCRNVNGDAGREVFGANDTFPGADGARLVTVTTTTTATPDAGIAPSPLA